MQRLLSGLAVATLSAAVASTTVQAKELKIDDLVHSKNGGAEEAATEAAARHFYEFWDTGEPKHLEMAIAPSFKDHTLPAGRPQGPEGPAFASTNFRKAVPDLHVEVKKLVLSGAYATVHMVFTGHYSGTFEGKKGSGQKIEFIATDLIKVHGGKVTDNWHIEDNLTLLKQLGVVK